MCISNPIKGIFLCSRYDVQAFVYYYYFSTYGYKSCDRTVQSDVYILSWWWQTNFQTKLAIILKIHEKDNEKSIWKSVALDQLRQLNLKYIIKYMEDINFVPLLLQHNLPPTIDQISQIFHSLFHGNWKLFHNNKNMTTFVYYDRARIAYPIARTFVIITITNIC